MELSGITTARLGILNNMVDVMGASLNITEAIKKGDKIKFVGDMATNPFQLQGKCASAKASLTKALTALEKTSLGFAD